MNHRIFTPFRASILAAALGLGVALPVAVLAGDRPEFPISLAEAKDRAEARFESLDVDGSGEISAEEFAAAEPAKRWGHRGPHGDRFRARQFDQPGAADRAETEDQLFERLDEDGDGLLSQAEFSRDKVREARKAAARERIFGHLDEDGSGGLSRTELPDGSRWLEAMDADGDGVVTREEAREHRHRGPHHGQRHQQRG